MPKKLTHAEWRELRAELIPRVADWICRYDDVLTVRGRKFADRAMVKANLAGEVGTRTLFEPVLLVSLADPAAEMSELLEVCDRIPFTGD